MKFNDFLKKGLVKKSIKNTSLVRSLYKQSRNDMEFLDNIEINKKSSRKMMSNYYDVLRAILEAIAILEGYKIYSHKAFTYFLKEIGEENISIKFERFRNIRNSINYYGEEIDKEEVLEKYNRDQKNNKLFN